MCYSLAAPLLSTLSLVILAACGETATLPVDAGELFVADDVGNVVWRVTSQEP